MQKNQKDEDGTQLGPSQTLLDFFGSTPSCDFVTTTDLLAGSNFQTSESPASTSRRVTIAEGTVVRREPEDFRALTSLDSRTGIVNSPLIQYTTKF